MSRKPSEKEKTRKKEKLSRLFSEDNHLFNAEWHTRMDTWLKEARRRSRGIVDKRGNTMPPIFDVVKYAKRLLDDCGIEETKLERHNNIKMLESECTKKVADLHDRKLYHISSIIERLSS